MLLISAEIKTKAQQPRIKQIPKSNKTEEGQKEWQPVYHNALIKCVTYCYNVLV